MSLNLFADDDDWFLHPFIFNEFLTHVYSSNLKCNFFSSAWFSPEEKGPGALNMKMWKNLNILTSWMVSGCNRECTIYTVFRLSNKHIYGGCTSSHTGVVVSSPRTALSTSIQPAVLWLLDLHGDHLSPGEGQQGGVGGTGLVGHLRPKGSPSTAASMWLSGGAINAFLGRRSWRDDELKCLLLHMLADETS